MDEWKRSGKHGRTCDFSSRSTWSYSLRAVQNMMDVTLSKQCIHFLRSERCPPTSNMCILSRTSGCDAIHERMTYDSWPMVKRASVMPTLFCRVRSTSVSSGRYSGVPILSTSPKSYRHTSTAEKEWNANKVTHYAAPSIK
jgi:hypothetical protein